MSSRHGHYQQSSARDNASLVLAFFLALTLAGELFAAVGRFCVLDEAGILGVFDDTYYAYALEHVEEELRYYTLPTGIDPVIVEGLVGTDDVRRDTRACVQAAFSGAVFLPNTSDLQQAIVDRVDAGLGQVGASDATAVTQYAQELCDVYVGAVAVPGLGQLSDTLRSVRMVLQVVMLVLAIAIIVLGVAIARLHHFVHRSLRFVSYAFGGAALMGGAAPLALMYTRPYAGLNLTPQSFHYLGVSLVDHLFRCCVYVAGSYLVVCISLIVVVVITRRRALKGKLKHSRTLRM